MKQPNPDRATILDSRIEPKTYSKSANKGLLGEGRAFSLKGDFCISGILTKRLIKKRNSLCKTTFSPPVNISFRGQQQLLKEENWFLEFKFPIFNKKLQDVYEIWPI